MNSSRNSAAARKATAKSSDPAVAVNTEARQGDISVWVDRYQWLVHDHSAHDHSEDANDPTSPAQNELPAVSGFPMSAAMMPGTPDEGFHRLQIDLSIVNRGEGTLEMKPADFRLVSEDGDEWPSLRGGTFSPTDLSGGYMLGTVLAFDVPEEFSSTGMYLEWTWEGEVTRFAFNGSGHDH